MLLKLTGQNLHPSCSLLECTRVKCAFNLDSLILEKSHSVQCSKCPSGLAAPCFLLLCTVSLYLLENLMSHSLHIGTQTSCCIFCFLLGLLWTFLICLFRFFLTKIFLLQIGHSTVVSLGFLTVQCLLALRNMDRLSSSYYLWESPL